MLGVTVSEVRGAVVKHESLALCLREVLATHGRTCTYEQIVAALGLGFATAAVPGEPAGQWPTFGRDAGLGLAAALLGLRLRELHPPAAARGLHRAGEFATHFADSYVPLIRAALAYGYPVLVWGGWPPPAERLWGLVTGEVEGKLIGRVGWEVSAGFTDGPQPGAGGVLPMVGPAQQVYVIEEISSAAEPSAAAAMDEWAAVTLALWCDRHALTGVHFGLAAYRVWLHVLGEPAEPDFDSSAAIGGHAQVVRVLGAARAALAGWLNEILPLLDAPRRLVAEAAKAACEELVARPGQLMCEELAAASEWVRAREAIRIAIQDIASIEEAVIRRWVEGPARVGPA